MADEIEALKARRAELERQIAALESLQSSLYMPGITLIPQEGAPSMTPISNCRICERPSSRSTPKSARWRPAANPEPFRALIQRPENRGAGFSRRPSLEACLFRANRRVDLAMEVAEDLLAFGGRRRDLALHALGRLLEIGLCI